MALRVFTSEQEEESGFISRDWEKISLNEEERLMQQEHEDEELQWFVKMQNPSTSHIVLEPGSSTSVRMASMGNSLELEDKKSTHESRSRSKHLTAHFE